MERLFQIAAALLGGTAAYFLWQGRNESAFVSGVLGCVAYFISFRFQVKKRNQERLDETLRRDHSGTGGSGGESEE